MEVTLRELNEYFNPFEKKDREISDVNYRLLARFYLQWNSAFWENCIPMDDNSRYKYVFDASNFYYKFRNHTYSTISISKIRKHIPKHIRGVYKEMYIKILNLIHRISNAISYGIISDKIETVDDLCFRIFSTKNINERYQFWNLKRYIMKYVLLVKQDL